MAMRQGLMKTRAYYVFSPWLRIFHWTMVICMVVLFGTGLYIADPFYIGTQGTEPTFAVDNLFSMSNIRLIHFAAGYILTILLLIKIYGFIVNKGDRLFPKPWTSHFWNGAADTALHYAFLRSKHRPYIRNSLARLSYAGIYLMILVQGVTGFAMYYMIEPNRSLAKIFGIFANEYTIHIVHHIVAWAIILFAIVHVYMVIRTDFVEKNGEISSMVSGIKYMEEEPDDIGDVIVSTDGKEMGEISNQNQAIKA